MPAILRKRPGSTYAFIGLVYVHGFMDGEAMKVVDRGELELKDFVMD